MLHNSIMVRRYGRGMSRLHGKICINNWLPVWTYPCPVFRIGLPIQEDSLSQNVMLNIPMGWKVMIIKSCTPVGSSSVHLLLSSVLTARMCRVKFGNSVKREHLTMIIRWNISICVTVCCLTFTRCPTKSQPTAIPCWEAWQWISPQIPGLLILITPICSAPLYWYDRYFIRNRKKRTSVSICRNTTADIGTIFGPERPLKEEENKCRQTPSTSFPYM